MKAMVSAIRLGLTAAAVVASASALTAQAQYRSSSLAAYKSAVRKNQSQSQGRGSSPSDYNSYNSLRDELMDEVRSEVRAELDIQRGRYDAALSGGGSGCDSCGGGGCGSCCDCVHPGWTFGADYLYWRLRSHDLDYARIQDSTAMQFGVGSNLNVPTARDDGFRLRAGYLDCSGWESAFVYTWFETDNAERVVDVAGVDIVPTRQAQLASPPSLDAAGGMYDLEYKVYDWEVGRWFFVDCSTAIRFFGGFRYAEIDQLFSARYERPGNIDDVFQSHNTEAYGIRIGVEGTRHVSYGLQLFARMGVSVLAADVNYHLLELNGNAAQNPVEVDLTDNYWMGVPVLEAAGGVEWCMGPYSLAAGYELTNWFNLAQSQRNTPVDANRSFVFTKENSDVLLEGIYVRAAYTR